MSLKNSTALKEDPAQLQRIRVSKRRDTSPLNNDEGSKRSMNIAEAFEHEKAMAQNYRQKNERNIMKCKFLYNKLTTLGNLEGVPEMIASEVSEVDVKIKQLEQLLNFRRTHQMKKLRKKVINFLQQINFEIQPEDMDKIEDEIEIILFLIDIFEQKFNEMTAERKEIDAIIARLEKENDSDLNVDYSDIKKENQKLLTKLSTLENQIEKLKKEDYRKVQTDYFQRDSHFNQSIPEEAVALKNLEIERHLKKVEDLQAELNDFKAKYKIIESDLQRAKREEVRLKERYKAMEGQKNQRIKLLEQSFNKNF